MKNSKPFPALDWLEDSFLTTAQRAMCRASLLADGPDLGLAAVGLLALGADMDRSGEKPQRTCLAPVEQEQLASFTFAKRRREWLGGRIAAKYAAAQLLAPAIVGDGYLSLRVGNDLAGRPYLQALGSEDRASPLILPHISISHSGDIAAALAVDRHPCGLDVQKITPKAIVVRDRFISPAEQMILSSAVVLDGKSEEETYSLLWAAKESLRKAFTSFPLLGFNEIILDGMESTDHGGILARFRCSRLTSILVPVFLVRWRGYACAVAVNRHLILPP